MAERLPPSPHLEWLKKRAKDLLAELRDKDAEASLADAQLAVAREHGFASWRALREHVVSSSVPPEDLPEPLVAKFLEHVGAGRRGKVQAMLASTPALVNAVGPHPFWGGRPQPLHVAIDANRDDMVALLLRAGADVNGRNDEYAHWSPLLLAVGKRREKARRMLLRRGARIGLVEALVLGDDLAVAKLLKRPLPEKTPNDGSLLMFARTPEAIDRLLELGVPIDEADRFGSTPMQALSRLGSRGNRLVRHLRARGAAAEPAVFARLGDLRTLTSLIDDDPRVAADPSVVRAAVDSRHRDLVARLLERGADPDARDGDGVSCLHSAAWNGDLAMVELLLEHGADPDVRDPEHDNTPAGWAETAINVTNNPSCGAVAALLRKRRP